jgi:DNA-binding CsgD family transcriptional regulator
MATMTLDMFRTGAVWLTVQGNVLYSNHEMDAIAGKRDGIQVSNGRLHLWDPKARQDLEKSIEAAISERSSGLLAERPSGLPRYRINVMPLPMQANGLRLPNAAAIAFVSEATAPTSASLQAARGMYNLTPAEAKITEKLATGLDPKQIADALGSSINTVRTQVKSILAKTGVSRQADLIRLVATLPQVAHS